MSEIVIPRRAKNLTGQAFGRLTVVRLAEIRIRSTGSTSLFWLCRCKCGKEVVVARSHLTSGHTQSCGCLHRQMTSAASKTHGASQTSLFRIWCGMIKRCEDPNASEFHRYGARGIKVCERWRGGNGFVNFRSDVGEPPTAQHSIERKANDGGYFPDNVIWATKTQQARNRRSNRLLTFNGRTLCIASWSDETGIPPSMIWSRVYRYGWSIDRALTTPAGIGNLRLITFRGETRSIAEWSKSIGIPAGVISSRTTRYGWTIERALTTRVMTPHEVAMCAGRSAALRE